MEFVLHADDGSRLRPAEATKRYVKYEGETVDTHPLAVFIFLYRSKSKFCPQNLSTSS